MTVQPKAGEPESWTDRWDIQSAVTNGALSDHVRARGLTETLHLPAPVDEFSLTAEKYSGTL